MGVCVPHKCARAGSRFQTHAHDELESQRATAQASEGASMNKLYLAVLAIWCNEAQAVLPGAPPKPVDEPTLATMRFCQIFSVRAAWGAEARFKGARS
jgi:hypothetical protein